MSQTSLFVGCIGFLALQFWVVGTIPVVPGGVVGQSPLSVGDAILSGYSSLNKDTTAPSTYSSCVWYNIVCGAQQTFAAIVGAVGSGIYYLSQIFAPVVYVVGAYAQISAFIIMYPWLGAIDGLVIVFLTYSVVKGLI